MAYRLGARPKVDIAILTVIAPELLAVRDALGMPERARFKDEAGTIVYSGRVHSTLTQRSHEVILTCIGRAGNAVSAAAVQDIIGQYRPQVVLLVGIAAGIRDKVRIGEVVLSERVVAYEPAAAVSTPEGGSRLEPRPEIRTLPLRMHQDAVHYQPDELRLRARFEQMGGIFPTPPAGSEALYHEHVATRVRLKVATIASGEKVLRDPNKLMEIRSLHGRTEVGEMEAQGLIEACDRSGTPWLIIRGISDFGDEFKDDCFHDFASRTAAVVLADFLEYGLDLARPRGRGRLLAVAAATLLIAAAVLRVHAWAQWSNANSQPPPVPSETQGARANAWAPLAPPAEPAPRPSLNPATESQEARETSPTTNKAVPIMRTEIGNVQAGHGATLEIGNVEGAGSSDTKMGDVGCGDNCVIKVGNKRVP